MKFGVFLVAIAGVSACDGPTNRSASTSLPAGLLVTAEPTDARSLRDAKAAAREGDRVVIRGRIGGSKDPFIGGRAVFTIVDMGVKSCKDMGDDDHCPTPWDYCCEPRENLLANSVTIQVTGPDGRPLNSGLSGVGGLTPLAEVVVVGRLVQRDDAGTFVVSADGLWVKPVGG